ncbi:MAG: hypothetical protein R2706_11130 [Acidimicrobiales bacterium]
MEPGQSEFFDRCPCLHADILGNHHRLQAAVLGSVELDGEVAYLHFEPAVVEPGRHRLIDDLSFIVGKILQLGPVERDDQ